MMEVYQSPLIWDKGFSKTFITKLFIIIFMFIVNYALNTFGWLYGIILLFVLVVPFLFVDIDFSYKGSEQRSILDYAENGTKSDRL